MNREEKRINNKCNFIDNLLLNNGLYKGISALVEIEEHISNLYDEIDKYKRQLDEKEQKIRLDQTKKIFEVLADAIKNGSISYRNLIYDKLGFTEHYADLIAGLTITNAIVDLEEKGKIINEILKECFYVCDCPVSRLDEDTNKLCNLLDCENCQENYKECWLKYFENKVLEGSKTT